MSTKKEWPLPSPSHGGSWKKKLAFILTGVVIFCLLFRVLMFTAQQNCLRVIVHDISTTCSDNNLDYWWDFGTLLGIIRGGDVIYTEVDADISIPMSTRKVFFDNEVFLLQLRHLGYRIEKRDENKIRLFGPWGMFADMDVWVPLANGSISMVTGKHVEKWRYTVPAHLLLPTRTLESVHLPAISDKMPPSIRVPAKPQEVLAYWYGPTWQTPRRFFKGNDPSTDPLEIFLWKYCVWVYELFLSFKVFFLISSNGLRSLLKGAFLFPNTAGFFCGFAVAYHIYRRSPQNFAVFLASLIILPLLVSGLVTCVVLALQG